MDFHKTREHRDSTPGGHTKKKKKCFACARTQRKGARTPQETELDPPRATGEARKTTIL